METGIPPPVWSGVIPVVLFLGCDPHIETKVLGALCEDIAEGGAYLMSLSLCSHCIALGAFYLDKLQEGNPPSRAEAPNRIVKFELVIRFPD
ncbi:hypothetical protein DAEQUDRAFT_770992 [Daedalea quercina L-15889]|uniref:Uncharacterized protein n=1 Tax=Daedalea quercina L-15889 TaxID=1314783 RepID=A0A165KEZ8_9APHY|nr:hypothetical protein DAEQUDRAFT_770992 [Daedalea quercina L-15889]